MTRFETQVWEPQQFYPIRFGTDVIDELLEMPAELRPILEGFDRYEQYKHDVNLEPFAGSKASMQRAIGEFEAAHSSSPQRPPKDSRPLYEFARFFAGSRGVATGLGTPAVRTVPGYNRGSKYVFAELDRAGVPNIENGALLVAPRHVGLSQYMLRRVGICYLVDGQGE